MLPSAAADWIDTSRLPRVSGARDIYASAATTIFTSPDPVTQTAETAAKALAAAGWQQYGRPFSAKADNPTLQTMEFKKGPQALSVFITVAPAQGNATSVQYTAIALANDLPFPKDATEIEFDADRPHLNAVVAEPVDQTLDFFRRELAGLGWWIWSMKDGANPQAAEIAGVKHEKGAYAYYVRDMHRPFAQRSLLLVLQNRNDGRAKVELKGVPPELLMAQSKHGHEDSGIPGIRSEARRGREPEGRRRTEGQSRGRSAVRAAQGGLGSDDRRVQQARAADGARRHGGRAVEHQEACGRAAAPTRFRAGFARARRKRRAHSGPRDRRSGRTRRRRRQARIRQRIERAGAGRVLPRRHDAARLEGKDLGDQPSQYGRAQFLESREGTHRSRSCRWARR